MSRKEQFSEITFLDTAQSGLRMVTSLARVLHLSAHQADEPQFADLGTMIESEAAKLRANIDEWEAGSYKPRKAAEAKAKAPAPKGPEYRDADLIERLQRVIAAQRKLPPPPNVKKGGAK